jgi:ribosomal protein S18 acetylase RimI-like enzyme
MTNVSNRLYEGKDDFLAMLDLMNRVRPAGRMQDYPVKVDIEENLESEEIRASTKLWFDDGRLIGWAYVDDFRNLRWELEKPYTDSVGKEMVAWGEECIRRSLAAGVSSTLDTSCREEDHERLDFLNRYGFRRAKGFSVHMERDLSTPIPVPELPRGFHIRPARGAQEAEAIARAHRAAFDSDYMTTENRLIIMNSSEYDPTLDLVVVTPDGSIAAYCTCSIESDGDGCTDPVAVHPHHQRKGLARALLLTGMQMLKERGARSAQFTTSSDNLAMQRAGEAAGFHLKSRTLWFEKEVN